MSKDTSDPCVGLRAVQFCGEGMIETAWPWIQPCGHLSPAEWLDVVADKGPQEVHTYQPTS
jgi:hypothetical protein